MEAGITFSSMHRSRILGDLWIKTLTTHGNFSKLMNHHATHLLVSGIHSQRRYCVLSVSAPISMNSCVPLVFPALGLLLRKPVFFSYQLIKLLGLSNKSKSRPPVVALLPTQSTTRMSESVHVLSASLCL